MDKITIDSFYSNFAKDSLGLLKCNTEFIEHSKNSYVVLKATKNINAYTEILISLDKQTCISNLRSDWVKTKENLSKFFHSMLFINL